ncbi:efflux RND transporter periplasmic adaptor subunit [Novilysobacter spongiicola]|uniref:RND family efflux transporter, MFP subunit n=1 Tax=Lysobacter spongiicola DSM 21749 TaxID=1122188 RepID=A0A1T4NCM4_9GAMM|nr:efflux RND transporter periplasmic adaptor subunit [Lysobacter spongiicola]SJZ76984.1 RND family efflux transporter, MFP subunit [Lysobacter spongiicola DSM 21749]
MRRLPISLASLRTRMLPAALIALALAGCDRTSGSASPDLQAQVHTHFTPRTELFVEFDPLVTGAKSTFAAHFTRLADYKPVEAGTVDVILSGGNAPTERFRVSAPRAPGIFAPTVLPRATGRRNLSLVITAPGLEARHELGEVTVYDDATAALEAGPAAGTTEGEIGFLKEQQWTTDFSIEAVQPRELRESVRAPATIRPSADGAAEVVATAAGTVRATGGFPALGDRVARGQTLAMLVPRLGSDTDVASLQADLATARSQAALAEAESARMERLYAQQAVSQRRLEEARAARKVAQAQLQAAGDRVSQLGGSSGGIAVKAPMAGMIALAPVSNGSAVEDGDLLFHIVNRDELWLEAHVSEADAARLESPTGASFELPGLDAPVEIRTADNGRLVGVGGMIDPESRSVPVIFAMDDPGPHIALNQDVEARVFTGGMRSGLSVPVGAVIDDGGQRVVYVMRGGESFSRVPVRLGLRDGDRYEVLEGLEAGQRVVSRGAMQVRLAAATPEAMGHGHAH